MQPTNLQSTPGQRASQSCIAMFFKMAAVFGIFERRLGMSKIWYKLRVLVPSGKAVVFHSQVNMVGCPFSFQKIPNMSWFCYRRTDFLQVTFLVQWRRFARHYKGKFLARKEFYNFPNNSISKTYFTSLRPGEESY